MPLLQSLTLGETCVDLYDNGIDTVFVDGKSVWAEPQDSDEYRATAHRLGYGGNTLALSIEHELSHTLVAVMMGQPYSPTLWGVAHGDYCPHYRQEEALVLAFQTYCRAAGINIVDLAFQRASGH